MVALITGFTLPSSYAIRGDLLPESELPEGVCRIVVGEIRHTFTPTDRFRSVDARKPTVSFRYFDHFMCSSDLVGENRLFTASHCFQGNVEGLPIRGRIPYPKLDEHGKRLKGCEGNDYIDIPRCVDRIQAGVLDTQWIDARVECPIKGTDRFEVRPLLKEMGYSNPFFRGSAPENKHTRSIAIGNFDVAAYRLTPPITTVKPLEVEWSYENIRKNFQPEEGGDPNPFLSVSLCRSFGYGQGDDGKSGQLRGANTPPTTYDAGFISSELETRRLPNTGWVDHGDSGGALLCRGKRDLHYKLYGIVSRGVNRTDIERALEGVDDRESMPFETLWDAARLQARTTYALPSYNKPFFDHVFSKGSFPRPLDKKWWWNFFYPFERSWVEDELKQAADCVRRRRREMSGSSYRMYMQGLRLVREKYEKSVVKEAGRYGEFDSGLFLSRLYSEGILQRNRQISWDCRNGNFFD